RMAEMALSNDINIPPTINVDQGTRIIVFVKRDLDFSDLYPDPVKEALYELRHPGQTRRSGSLLWETLPVYFRQAASPIRRFLQDTDVIEICVNRPGEVWIEALGRPAMERFEVPEMTEEAIGRLATHVASFTSQSVNSSTPLLSAAMPHGERFQGVLAPATPHGGGFSIRKQVIANLTLSDYARIGGFNDVKVRGPRDPERDEYPEIETELAEMLRDTSASGVRAALEYAVLNHVTMIISGGTSSGKTTFLNALLKTVPDTERVITIEDTRELNPPQPNWL